MCVCLEKVHSASEEHRHHRREGEGHGQDKLRRSQSRQVEAVLSCRSNSESSPKLRKQVGSIKILLPFVECSSATMFEAIRHLDSRVQVLRLSTIQHANPKVRPSKATLP